eukprot:TRINITY_DN69665_c0_g1_i1.p1 TRINITY_DN69665_c0_g1~~TRINITY_DN69665_c0_g1_i1.p1  ORF type:complete len:736 (+),score=125.72 TRINITY_DN69665_c0_g1_i1:101-2209(+)
MADQRVQGRPLRLPAEELPRGLGSLRTELDVMLRRHNEEIKVCVERWSALRESGWRSAPSEIPKAEGTRTISLPGENFAAPAFPASNFLARKLPPPRAPLTPVTSSGGTVRRSVPKEAEFASSPRSISTRSCTNSHGTPPAGEDDFCPGPACSVSTRVCVSVDETPAPPSCTPPALPPQPVEENCARSRQAHGILNRNGMAQYVDTVGRSISDSDTEGSAERSISFPSDDSRRPPPQKLESTWLCTNKSNTMNSLLRSPTKRHLYGPRGGAPALRRITRSSTYEFVSAVVILLNAMLIVWETQRRSLRAESTPATESKAGRNQNDDMFFDVASNCFCVIFMVDLALRMMAERFQFFKSKDRGWNIFDTFVVFSSVLEAVAHLFTAFSDSTDMRRFLRKFSVLRILRFLRVVRVTRALRVIRFIRELRLMVFSLTASLRSLAWAVVMIFFTVLVFGIIFTDGIISYCIANDAMNSESTAAMRKYFGSVDKSTISLFMAMAGGEEWAVMLESIEPLPMEYTFLFFIFICFAVLALLNVVTAVFINTALQRSQSDRELAVQQEMEMKDEMTALIEQLFVELDTNQTGALTWDEFESHIEDEKVLAYLKSLGIDIGQARTLFTLLDADQTGDVDMEEFVRGVLRLKGGATSMDLAVLTYQVEWMLHSIRGRLTPSRVDSQDGNPPGEIMDIVEAPRINRRFSFSAA